MSSSSKSRRLALVSLDVWSGESTVAETSLSLPYNPLPGKTMTANAVANYLHKKVLLVTVSVLLEKDLTKVS